ncbi:MAG TPA: EscU/YscU/HrcU family type III secretion system export apparatus switch protein [Turneriella sp.]|nr:EscU/YscU/HrcU family type III secretion system export apparatus switch protein [Turneriella sp.]
MKNNVTRIDSTLLKDVLRACALEYKGEGAPIVKAYAEGEAAQRMLEIARKHGVQIQEGQEESLLLALKSVKLNTQIPTEIYLAVARIYAYLIGKKKE